jgi:hypothetical protein
MKFLRDVNLPDHSVVGTDEVLIKRWQLVNDGSVTWPAGSKLIFVRGDRELVDAEEFEVTSNVKPGDEVEVSVVLKTPSVGGRYQAFFRLADADRNSFGNRVWVDLVVEAVEKKQEEPLPVSVSVSAPAPVVKPAVVIPVAEPVSLVRQSPVPTPVVEEQATSSPASMLEASSSSVAVPIVTEPPAKYARELQLLAGLGFNNRELNTYLLDAKQGDLIAVADWLLEKK